MSDKNDIGRCLKQLIEQAPQTNRREIGKLLFPITGLLQFGKINNMAKYSIACLENAILNRLP